MLRCKYILLLLWINLCWQHSWHLLQVLDLAFFALFSSILWHHLRECALLCQEIRYIDWDHFITVDYNWYSFSIGIWSVICWCKYRRCSSVSVKLFEVIETQRTLYLVLEHASGGELFCFFYLHAKWEKNFLVEMALHCLQVHAQNFWVIFINWGFTFCLNLYLIVLQCCAVSYMCGSYQKLIDWWGCTVFDVVRILTMLDSIIQLERWVFLTLAYEENE